MGHQPLYKCTRCNQEQEREDLIAVKVSFVTLGSKGATLRSRTPDWLCFPCLNKDKIWNLPEYDSPGLRTAEEEASRNPPNLTAKYQQKKADRGQ